MIGHSKHSLFNLSLSYGPIAQDALINHYIIIIIITIIIIIIIYIYIYIYIYIIDIIIDILRTLYI